MSLFHTLRNAVDFPLRRLIRWRRRGLVLRDESKEHLFDYLAPAERETAEAGERRLRETYHLGLLHDSSSCHNYRVNLFYLELLERALDELGAPLAAELDAVDIGPSHWFYVQALHGLLRWHAAPAGRQVRLSGYEIDPWRVYPDLRSRHDHALAHIRGVAGITYVPEAFAPQPGRFGFVLLPFPFVFLRDHLRWGLPRRLFDPRQLLAGAWASVAPGGTLLIVNQGEAEHEAQRAMLAGLPVAAAFRHDSVFYRHDLPRYVLAARRAEV